MNRPNESADIASRSYRQILRSTSIFGGASVVKIVLGLIRIKVAALILGPAGIGLIGILATLVTVFSGLAGLGFRNVGTRQIALASGQKDVSSLAAARSALFWGTLVLAAVGALVFWTLRVQIAQWVVGDEALSYEVGWLALAVALTVASASQSALLNGMRRVGDLARVTIWSGLWSTLLGTIALMSLGRDGLLVFILAGPIASFVLGHVYVARLPAVKAPHSRWSDLVGQWSTFAKLGSAFMMAGLVGTVGQLLVRSLVQHELGTNALGYFQAAATISITYVGIVLAAMGADYYPRLTKVIDSPFAVNRLVNEQSEVALLLASPIFLAILGMAPWVIELLYTESFGAAVDVLRWQVAGDVLKICSWPLGFVILAAGRGRVFLMTELIAATVLVCLTWALLPLQGVVGTGQAFFGMNLVLLAVVYGLARLRTGFRWSTEVFRQILALFAATLIVLVIGFWSSIGAAVVGCFGALGFGVFGLSRLSTMTNLTGRIGQAGGLSRDLMSKIGLKSE